MFHMNFVQTAAFDWLQRQLRKFSKAIQNIFSITVIGINVNLCIHVYVYDISLYITCVFHCPCPFTFVAMATYSSHRLTMGKV